MAVDILSFLFGLVLLYFGAEGLVRGSSALALRLGVPPLLVGLTIVAFGTSTPELVVSVKAAMDGNGAISLGNVIGSNICNIALILGMSAVIRPLIIQVQVVRYEIPVMIAVSVLFCLMAWNGRVGRIEAAVFLIAFTVYLVAGFLRTRRESPAVNQAEIREAIPKPVRPLWIYALYVLGGLAMLVLGGRFLVDAAVHIAVAAGVSQAVIGLTIVAVGTSLPELATSAIASLKGEADIAVGNVVGSNIFNILLILGVSGLIRPISSLDMSSMDLAMMTVTAALCLPLMRTGYVLSRREGAVLLMIYVGYVVYLTGGMGA